MNLIHMFLEGGFIMWPLLLSFIISIVVVVDKLITLRKFNQEVATIDRYFQDKTLKAKLNEHNNYVIAPYEVFYGTPDVAEQEVLLLTEKTQKELKSRLWLLGTVTSSAPFIGLFGTVIGIIKSFSTIGLAGKAGFAVVSADLSEALIATAAGILVAVIALILYNFIGQRIKDSFFNYKFNLSQHFSKFKREG